MSQDTIAKPYPQDHVLKWVLLWMIPRWVKPNYLTALRFVLTVPVVWLVVRHRYVEAVPLFMFTAFTDAIDGALARTRNQITEWGELFDPVADKLLIGSVGLLLIFRYLHWVLIVIILSLEAATVLWAFVMKRKDPNRKINANIYGKTKMVLQCLGVLCLLFFAQMPESHIFSWTISGIFAVSIVFTVLSMRRGGI